MIKKISEFYSNNITSLWVQILIPSGLGGIIYVAKQYPEKTFADVIGIAAIFLLAIHAYLISNTTITKLKEVDFWKKELKGHKWLLNTIKEMVTRKLHKFKNTGYLVGESEYREAIMKNLSMLLKFYQRYSDDPDNSFRITYFKKSGDANFLESIFYATEDGEPPYSHGDIERQREIFDKNSSQSLAVTAWKELRPIIAENEIEITYLYPQQTDKIKSIIALPVFSGSISEDNLIGIITIASNKKEFFKRIDIERHKDYIDEFLLRIVFEFFKLKSSISNNRL